MMTMTMMMMVMMMMIVVVVVVVMASVIVTAIAIPTVIVTVIAIVIVIRHCQWLFGFFGFLAFWLVGFLACHCHCVIVSLPVSLSVPVSISMSVSVVVNTYLILHPGTSFNLLRLQMWLLWHSYITMMIKMQLGNFRFRSGPTSSSPRSKVARPAHGCIAGKGTWSVLNAT